MRVHRSRLRCDARPFFGERVRPSKNPIASALTPLHVCVCVSSYLQPHIVCYNFSLARARFSRLLSLRGMAAKKKKRREKENEKRGGGSKEIPRGRKFAGISSLRTPEKSSRDATSPFNPQFRWRFFLSSPPSSAVQRDVTRIFELTRRRARTSPDQSRERKEERTSRR